jgi:hypothetical protein
MLRLKEANWSSDGTQLGLLLCNWGRPLLFGYDTASGRRLDSQKFRGLIEEQLKRKYHLTPDTPDVLYWACTDGSAVYRRRYGR